MACSQLPLTPRACPPPEISLVKTAQRGCSRFQNHSVLYLINILPTKALPGTLQNHLIKEQPNITEYSSRARPTLSYVILTKALQGKITGFQGRNRLRGLRKERPLNGFSSLYQLTLPPAAPLQANPHVGCEETAASHWKVAAALKRQRQSEARIQTQHKEATGLIQRPDSFRPCSSGPPAPRFSSETQHRPYNPGLRAGRFP